DYAECPRPLREWWPDGGGELLRSLRRPAGRREGVLRNAAGGARLRDDDADGRALAELRRPAGVAAARPKDPPAGVDAPHRPQVAAAGAQRLARRRHAAAGRPGVALPPLRVGD